MPIFRRAENADVPAVAGIYEAIHGQEERGESSVGWIRGVYPTQDTARQAVARGDLFVAEEDGAIVAAAIINRTQVDVYAGAPWEHPARDREVMVLHTLVVSPEASGRGMGSAFVGFYEQYARENESPYLRMDTNARNARARRLYARLGYREIAVVPCRFNGIPGVDLVLLEKKL